MAKVSKKGEKWTSPDKTKKYKQYCEECKFYNNEYCLTHDKAVRYSNISCDNFILTDKKSDGKEPDVPPHITEKAMEIMEKGDPVKFIHDTHQRLHVGDNMISKALIIGVGCQSANNTDGIQKKLDGASGKGKTHSAKTFMEFIPKSHKIIGSCSDKVLFYSKIQPGTVIFSDDITITEDMNATIKRSMSSYQEEIEHRTLNKDREPETHTLPSRIMWILATVENDQSIQLLNRSFGGSVDESPEQDEAVYDHQVLSGMLGGVFRASIADDVLICREIIKDIKTKLFHVNIPFLYLIEWKDKGNRRNFPMFLDMIRAFAVYRYKQRKVYGNILFANLQDFEDAKALYESNSAGQKTKLSNRELKIVRYLSTVNSADVPDIMKDTGYSQSQVSQIMKGRNDVKDSGLLSKIKGLTEAKIFVKDWIEETNYTKVELIPTNEGRRTKTIYRLTGFNSAGLDDSVVGIGKIEQEEFNTHYVNITLTLRDIINNSKDNITYITYNSIVHSNERYNNSLLHVLFPKRRNVVINSSPDSESEGVKSQLKNLIRVRQIITASKCRYAMNAITPELRKELIEKISSELKFNAEEAESYLDVGIAEIRKV
ncbi:MAG: hypothetical protein OIN83_08315 [Candidatus Methanoperedens sp.]|nr:hypothetical protein [Candidatus Methanoperedens sp.]